MNLSAPKQTTWWLAFVLGVVGIAGHYVSLPIISAVDFWFVVAGFVLLTLATLLKNL
jgi:threonine/homoserine/homoserine lactone efflux protein